MKVVSEQYGHAHFSGLLASVERGQEIIITRGDRPVARLVPIEEQSDRVLGFVSNSIPESFFDPLSDDELAAWENNPLAFTAEGLFSVKKSSSVVLHCAFPRR